MTSHEYGDSVILTPHNPASCEQESIAGSRTNFLAGVNQENQRQISGTAAATLRPSATINLPQDLSSKADLVDGNSPRMAVSEPGKPTSEDPEQLRQRSLLPGNRTAQWLSNFLGSRRVSHSSSLTRFPEKLHPRHGQHNYKGYPESEFVTRVPTFTDKNTADADAMGLAMKNLEALLGKALEMANKAAEYDKLHAADIQPQSYFLEHSDPDDCHSHHASMLVSPQRKISSAKDKMRAQPQSHFVGARETAGHGCEAIPLRAIKRRGLAELDMHNGVVRGSTLPARVSSLENHKLVKEQNAAELPPSSTPTVPPMETQQESQWFHPSPDSPYCHSQCKITRQCMKNDESDSSETCGCILTAGQICSTSVGSTKTDVFTLRYRSPTLCTLDGSASDDSAGVSISSPRGEGHSSSRGGKKRHYHGAGSAFEHTEDSERKPGNKRVEALQKINLRKASHHSIQEAEFSLIKSHRRQPIARDWSPARKRFVAIVVCLGTALIGALVGIYAGVVPAVQYYIADTDHTAILGNVGMYLGMALPTFFCWPLALLHGRKIYILSGLTIAMPLLFPQAITVSAHRSARTSVWKWLLLLPRALMGVSLGFANMNFHSTLTDLYGASLMSSNPHQEFVDHHDVRRHGGGLGVWLGVWTWCLIGSLGLGFLLGALIIDSTSPAWGFYLSIIMIAILLILNVLTPEARRSVWRRSVTEVQLGDRVSRRVARGEIMMHRVKDGPSWWGQEVWHGVLLSLEMLRQPGFAVVAVYSAWIYAQVVLVIVLLGSLTSKYYHLRASYVGAAVSSVPIGALVAVPFQKANLFSRARYQPSKSNQLTFDKQLTWTSHLVRRAIFTTLLPVAGVLYAVVSLGPPVHIFFPCFLAAVIGFLSCLAISECNGILMETWDCSDLQPSMTGRSKRSSKKTNYSVFPRVQAGHATIHSLGFIFAAGATGIGGMAERNLGQRTASALVASILLALTFLLLAVLVRFRKVEIIPRSKTGEMDRWTEEHKANVRRRASAIAAAKATGNKDLDHVPEDEVGWRPLIIGNPSEKMRRMNMLEFGSLTRWTEIRSRNRLIDESAQKNRRALELAREELGHRSQEMLDDLARGGAMVMDMARSVSRRSLRSKGSHEGSTDDEGSPRPLHHGHTQSGHGHGHSHAASPLAETENMKGQGAAEDSDDGSSVVEEGNANEECRRHGQQDYALHATAKVPPYEGFEMQNLQGDRQSQQR